MQERTLRVFRLSKSTSGDRPFVVERRNFTLDKLGDVIAISYAWGSLVHKVTYPFSNEDELAVTLGPEWDRDRFLDELVALSRGAWLWFDQISILQKNASTEELNISIPTIFKQGRVVVLLPGRNCSERRKALELASENHRDDSRAISLSSFVVEQFVNHARTCHIDCVGGIDVWLRRVWPWQEFAYANRIQVRFVAGSPPAIRRPPLECDRVTPDVVTLLRQQVLDKNIRLQILGEHEQTRRFIRLLSEEEVAFGVFREPTGQAMLQYMSNYVEQNRVCTKDTDLTSAVAPAIYAKVNRERSLGDAVSDLIEHMERETSTIFVGPLPSGIIEDTVTALAHPRTFEGLDEFSNVGKISFLHGTHFANSDLDGNVDDSITIETIRLETGRREGREVSQLLVDLSLSQKRMLARWLASWKQAEEGPGTFDRVILWLKETFARSQATIDASGNFKIDRMLKIHNPAELVRLGLILLRVIDGETSDLSDVLVAQCELVTITKKISVVDARTAVGYRRKGSKSKLVAVGDCLMFVDSFDNTKVVGRVPYTSRGAMRFVSSSVFSIVATSTDTPIRPAVGSLARPLAPVVQQAILHIDANSIEFLDLSGGHVDDAAAIALSEALASNTSLKALLLHNNRMGERGLVAISTMLAVNTTLEAVHLPYVETGAKNATLDDDQRVVRWTRSSQSNWHGLFFGKGNNTWVNSEGTPVDTQIVTALAEVIKYKPIDSLSLNETEINTDAMRALASGFEASKTIFSVGLRNNSISDDGMVALARVFRVNKSIGSLDIRGSIIRSTVARALGDALSENKTVTELFLKANAIDDDSVEALFDGLYDNRHIESLTLSDNSIGDRGATAIAAALLKGFNKICDFMSLDNNLIGDAGAKALANALSKFVQLDLSGNRISDDGAIALAKSLSMQHSLRILNLGDNQIGDTGATLIAQAVAKSETITDVLLHDNPIGDAGARAFVETIRTAKSLEHLRLDAASIGAELREELRRANTRGDRFINVSVQAESKIFPRKLRPNSSAP